MEMYPLACPWRRSSALHLAMSCGHEKCCDWLLQAKRDLEELITDPDELGQALAHAHTRT